MHLTQTLPSLEIPAFEAAQSHHRRMREGFGGIQQVSQHWAHLVTSSRWAWAGDSRTTSALMQSANTPHIQTALPGSIGLNWGYLNDQLKFLYTKPLPCNGKPSGRKEHKQVMAEVISAGLLPNSKGGGRWSKLTGGGTDNLEEISWGLQHLNKDS